MDSYYVTSEALDVTSDILRRAITSIDSHLAPGYALKNPALVAAYMAAASRVFQGLTMTMEPEGEDA